MISEDLPTLGEITAMERAYTEDGQPALGPARAALVRRWRGGVHDRETALRLAFLDWFACSEPDFLTGLPDVYSVEPSDTSYFPAASQWLIAEYPDDPEVLFCLGLMFSSFPECVGVPPMEAEREGELLLARFWIRPELDADVFTGRGAYGQYFAHMRRHARPPTSAGPRARPTRRGWLGRRR